MTLCYVAGGETWYGDMSFNPDPGKAKTEHEAILKAYELFIYGDIHCINDKFCKSALKGVKP